jgi:hypothetical protein
MPITEPGRIAISHLAREQYPQGARLLPPAQVAYRAAFASWPGEVDAFSTAASPVSKGVPVLYVALGL